MPNIEKQIAEWRRSMAQATQHRPAALDELEAHLREEIDRFVRTGSSPQQAFDLAMSRLGTPAELSGEFQKLDQMRHAKWKPATVAQWASVVVAALAILLLVPRIGHGRMTVLLASHVISVTIGYVMMFITGGLAICYILTDSFHRAGSSERLALRRTIPRLAAVSATLTGIAIILGMFWANQNLGRYWAWDPKETGGAVVFLCALATASLWWLKPAGHGVMVTSALVGNIGTAWGWFGMNAPNHSRVWLISFVISHCLLLAAFWATAWMRNPRRLAQSRG